MADFSRQVDKWYVSYRTYAAVAAVLAAIAYPIFGINISKEQQEGMVSTFEIFVPAALSLTGAILNLLSKRKESKKQLQRRAEDVEAPQD